MCRRRPEHSASKNGAEAEAVGEILELISEKIKRKGAFVLIVSLRVSNTKALLAPGEHLREEGSSPKQGEGKVYWTGLGSFCFFKKSQNCIFLGQQQQSPQGIQAPKAGGGKGILGKNLLFIFKKLKCFFYQGSNSSSPKGKRLTSEFQNKLQNTFVISNM